MGVKHGTVSLWTVFLRYLLFLGLGTALLAVLFLTVFSAVWQSGLLLPANASEIRIEQRKEQIASARKVTPDLIPEGCDYAVFSEKGDFLSGSISEKEAKSLKSAIQEGRGMVGGLGGTFLGAEYYKVFQTEQGYCSVLYSVSAQFSSPKLRRWFPQPEIIYFVLFLFCFGVLVFLFSRRFGRKMRKKLDPLRLAADSIRRQDLDFSAEYGGIREIDETLDSLSALRNELKKSLESQWRAEQRRKDEISELAHDVKTPLTVVRGNAEMLSETELTGEQKKYADYIEKASERMEGYLEMLIGLSRTEEGNSFHLAKLDSADFFKSLKNQAEALASAKGIKAEAVMEKGFPAAFTADADLLQRAVMNVVSNAAERSPEGKTVFLRASCGGPYIAFTVTDCGPGFSPADLKNATERFYRGDSGRSSGFHFGMGLFIADSVAKRHGGSVLVSNSPVTGGGAVELRISKAL